MSARVAVATFAPTLGDLEANVQASTELVVAARQGGADIIVLPELCLSGYMFESIDEVEATAVTTDHPVFESWSQSLGGRPGLVVGSFAERMPDGTFCISAAAVNSNGIVAVYRKAHLWNREKQFFREGNDPAPVVTTPWGRVGILICYDLEFFEMPRALAMRGADMLAVPTNWSLDLGGDGSEPTQISIARATASLNHVYVACCDRTGIERGEIFAGGSALVDSRGGLVARRGIPGIEFTDFDLYQARHRRISLVNDVFEDRRPELYV